MLHELRLDTFALCPSRHTLVACSLIYSYHQRSARTRTPEPTDMSIINIDHHGHRIDIATTLRDSRCRYSCRCRVLVTSKASRIASHSHTLNRMTTHSTAGSTNHNLLPSSFSDVRALSYSLQCTARASPPITPSLLSRIQEIREYK